MAETTNTLLTSTFVSVAAAGTWAALQITGSGDAEIYLGDAPVQGFILKNLDGMNPASFGDSQVWAKIANGAPKIIIHLV
jgi:hypothetical protein